MHNLKLPLKSPSSFHNFCISTSFLSEGGALCFLLAPRKMSSPVPCRFNRKLRSNGLKLSLFDLSFNCWRVCRKMQIIQDVSMLILHVVKHAWSLNHYCKYNVERTDIFVVVEVTRKKGRRLIKLFTPNSAQSQN